MLAETLKALGAERFGVLGPAPAPLGRLRGESRVQLFLKGRDRAAMRQATRQALAGMPSLHKHVTVDVDPLSMLLKNFRTSITSKFTTISAPSTVGRGDEIRTSAI